MAKERVIRISTELDTSGMLSGINQMRQMLGNINVDSNLFKDVNKDLDKITKDILEVKNSLKNGIPEKGVTSFLNKIENINKVYSALPDKIKQVQINTQNIRFSNQTIQQLEALDQQIVKLGEDAKKAIGEDLKASLRNAVPKDVISDATLKTLTEATDKTKAFSDYFDQMADSAEVAKAKVASSIKDIANTIVKNTDANATQKRAAFSQFGTAAMNALQGGAMVNVNAKDIAQRAANIGATKKQYEALKKAIIDYQDTLQSSNNVLAQRQTILDIISKAESDAAQMTTQAANLTIQKEQSITNVLKDRQQAQQQAGQAAEANGKKTVNALNQVSEGAQKATTHLQKQDSLLKQLASRATSLIGIGAVFNYITRGIRDAWNSIKELDKEFTAIAVVTDKTTSQLWQSFNTYAQMAQGLGVATKDAVATSALYYQQGLKTADVMTLTAETIKMAQIAGMDFKTATDQMTAALRGYNLEMSQANMVNDIFSTLAANAAVDTKELSYALTKTASIAESAGMSIDTTSAFLAKMIETTREAPENIGTAMKSIVARFEELKKNPLALSVDVEGEEVVANKVEAAIALAGVRLRDETTGQFRNLDDVFLELAKSWDNLDRNTQRYIATIAAGSRQQSRFIALMDGYDRTLELVELAQDSEGQSAAQFLKTLDSLDSKINKIRNSLEQLYQKFVNSDLFGGLLDGLNSLLQDFGKWDASTLAIFVTAGVVIGNNLINGMKQALHTSGDLFQTLTAPNVLKTLQEKHNTAIRSQMQARTNLTNAQSDLNVKNSKYEQELATYTSWFNGRKRVQLAYTINDAQAIAKIKALKTTISELETQIKTPEQFGLDKTVAENKLKELQAELATTESDIKAKYGSDYSKRIGQTTKNNFNKLTEAETARMRAKINNDFAVQSADAAAQAEEETSRQFEEQQKLLKEEAEKLKVSSADAFRNVGMSLVTSLSIGITMALEQENPAAAIGASFSTMLMQMTPLLMQQLNAAMAAAKVTIAGGMAKIRAAVDAAGGPITLALEGIALAISILGPLVANAIKNVKSESQKLKDEIDDLEERQKKLQEVAERTTAEAAVSKTSYKKLEKFKEQYFELYEKSGRTADENERLAKIIEEIEENFPDLVESYDEAGNAILKQKEDWKEIVQLQKESTINATKSAAIDKLLSIENEKRIAQLEVERDKAVVKEDLTERVQYMSYSDVFPESTDFEPYSDYTDELKAFRGKIAEIALSSSDNFIKWLAKQYNLSSTNPTEIFSNEKFQENTNYDYYKNLYDKLKKDENNANEYVKQFNQIKEKEKAEITNYFTDFIENFPLDDNIKEYSQNTIKNLAKKKAEDAVNNQQYSIEELLKTPDLLTKMVSSGAITTSEKITLSKYSNEINKIQNGETTLEEAFSENAQGLADYENAIKKYLEIIYENTVNETMELLSKTKSKMQEEGKEREFNVLNNMGSYGADTVNTIYKSTPDEQRGVFEQSYNAWKDQVTELSDKGGVIDRIIAKYGTDLAQYIKNQNLGQTAAEAVVESLNSLQLSEDEAKGLIDLLNSITDWSDPTAIKQLSEEILKLTGNTERAVDTAFDLREAFENPFKMDLNATSAFAELGKQISDVKKKYKDLNSAIEEYNEYGKLSGETILNLVESGNIMYLSYDKQTKAVQINAEAVEAAFKMEMLEAKQSLELKRQNAIIALAELEREQSINEQKLTILQNALKAKTNVGRVSALERLKEQKKEDKTELAVEQTNNELMIEESNNFFTQLQDAQKIGYGNLISLAKSAGEKQREAYIGSLSNGFDKNGAWTGDFGVVLATPTKYQSSDTLKEYEDRVQGIIDDIGKVPDNKIEEEINKLIEETKTEIQENEKAQEAYREYLKAIEQGMSVVEAFTSSGMSDFYKDTSSALADAKKELEDYISTLEKYYTLQKQIEKSEKDRQKALDQYKKTGDVKYLQQYISESENTLKKKGQLAYVGRTEKDISMATAKTKLASYFTADELKQLQFDPTTGLVDYDKFRETQAYKSKAQDDKQGKEIEDILKTLFSDVEKYQGWIDDYDDFAISYQEELEDLKKEAEKIAKSIDRLQNINQAMESIKEVLEEAKDLNEEYFSSGGREGIGAMQYLKTQAEGINSENLAQGKYKKLQAEYAKELTDKGFDQYIDKTSPDGKIYYKQGYAKELTAQGTEGQEQLESLQDLVGKYNELTDAVEDSEKAQRESAKAMREYARSLKKSYSDLITRVADDMAALDQKQIDEIKKKYAMIQEEDDKYLDALQKSIDKQRQLRDQANSYDDLEKQEKRLALLERDTSGANAAEIAALKEQIKDARQNLVDTEQDNIVNNISEANTLRKDKMDEETTFLQNVMDERTYDMQYYLDKARDIVDAAINGDAGAYQQMLEIMQEAESEFYRVTREAQDEWLQSLTEDYEKSKGWVEIVSAGYDGITNETVNHIKKISDTMADSDHGASELSNKIDGINKNINTIEAGDPFKILNANLDTAITNIRTLQEEIANGKYDIEIPIVYKAVGDVPDGTGGAGGTVSSDTANNYRNMRLSNSGTYAVGHYDSTTDKRVITGYTDDEGFAKYSAQQGGQGYWVKADRVQINAKDDVNNNEDFEWYKGSAPAKEVLKTEEIEDNQNYVIKRDLANGIDTVVKEGNEKETLDFVKNQKSSNSFEYERIAGYNLKERIKKKDIYKAFANGGLVNYTGPAWVDGTPSTPEAFLSADDTRNFQELAKILQNVLNFNKAPVATAEKDKIQIKSGDTNIEIHIEVDKIDSEESMEELCDMMADRIQQSYSGGISQP